MITVLHLCVMYNRLNIFILILELLNYQDLSSIKDDDGNTILHSAAPLRRIQGKTLVQLFVEDIITQ